MKWFNKLFEKKEKPQEEEPKEEVRQIPSPLPKSAWVCNFCKGAIEPGERWSKFVGSYFHKQCFKQIKRGSFSGQ